MQLGLIGLGRMGGNMRERLRARRPRGHRLRPQAGVSDVADLAELVGKLAPPRVVWVDGAGRGHRARPSTSWPP